MKTSFSAKELLARVKTHFELGRLRVHLELEIAKKTEQLTQLNTALKEFIDMICHEIRNPLHGITCSLPILAEKIDAINKRDKEYVDFSGDIAEMKEYLSNLKECAIHQTRVMDEVVLLARMYSNKFYLTASESNLDILVDKILKSLEEKLRLKRVTVQRWPVALFKVVQVDLQCLKQILTSLIMLVIDNVELGSVINISQSLVNIDNSALRLTVRITSPNLKVDQSEFKRLISLQPKSFVSRSVGRHYSNTGFSLAISDRLVQLMSDSTCSGINVVAEKESEQGFSFTIDCKQLAELPTPTNGKAKLIQTATRRVLLAEDNHVNQAVCKALLSKLAYECIVANDGKEALEKYQPGMYDFILMDIAMPEIDGLEVTRRIREIEAENNATPVYIIGVSAFAQQEYIQTAYAAGMNEFICKPATLSKISAIINKRT